MTAVYALMHVQTHAQMIITFI